MVIPGFLFVLGYDYLQSILARPLTQQVVLPDILLTYLILLSFFFAYGGLAVHAVTKMLAEELRHEDSEANQINRFFHLSFSHNLVFGGVLLVVVGFVLLELNHVPSGEIGSVMFSVAKGLVLGVSFGLLMNMLWKMLR